MEAATSSWTIGSLSGATLLTISYAAFKAVNHSRVRSVCCGRRCDTSIDVDTTQSTTDAIVIEQTPTTPVTARTTTQLSEVVIVPSPKPMNALATPMPSTLVI
jgi:alpha-D-ribose 1-methylphosphonate 5-phosphate C-P lyase